MLIRLDVGSDTVSKSLEIVVNLVIVPQLLGGSTLTSRSQIRELTERETLQRELVTVEVNLDSKAVVGRPTLGNIIV